MLVRCRRSFPRRLVFFGFAFDCGVACCEALAAGFAIDISGLLLPQHEMSCDEIPDTEETEDQRVEPEIGIAQSLRERADTDWVKPGRRKHQADQPALAGER